MKNILSVFLFLLSLIFVSPVFAGGGPIYIHADPNLEQWQGVDSRMFIVRFHLAPTVECKGRKVTFEYESPVKGDYISTGSSNQTHTITEANIRTVSGRSVPDCTAYAKYYSSERIAKTAKVSVEMPNGSIDYRTIVLNFQIDDLKSSEGDYSLPWDNEYVPTPISNQYPFTVIFPSAGAILKQESTYKILWSGWDKNDGNNVTSYSVYLVGGNLGSTGNRYLGSVDLNSQDWFSWTVPSDITPGYGYQIQFSGKGANGDNSESFSIAKQEPESTLPRKIMLNVGNQIYNGGPKRTVYLSWNQVSQAKNYNVYVRLSDQKEFGEGLFGKPGTEYLYGYIGINAFLDYYIRVEACSNEGKCTYSPEVFLPTMKQDNQEKNQDSNLTNPEVTPSINTNGDEIEQLNKKVETLQNQLDDSAKKQNILEQRITALVSWIKSVFPFFK